MKRNPVPHCVRTLFPYSLSSWFLTHKVCLSLTSTVKALGSFIVKQCKPHRAFPSLHRHCCGILEHLLSAWLYVFVCVWNSGKVMCWCLGAALQGVLPSQKRKQGERSCCWCWKSVTGSFNLPISQTVDELCHYNHSFLFFWSFLRVKEKGMLLSKSRHNTMQKFCATISKTTHSFMFCKENEK